VTALRRLEVPTPVFGWDHPWPNVFEVVAAFPAANWTLVGGLMVQARAIAHGVPLNRPTEDLDMLLHVEIITGVTGEAAHQLESLGYTLQPPLTRRGPAYRFTRGTDQIDVLSPDHTGKLNPRLRRNPMFAAVGGKQALDRRMLLAFETANGTLDVSVPDELGALVLKAAAHMSDTRDRERHLTDAATLAACITAPAAERARLKGSDTKRLRHLAEALDDRRHPAWRLLPEPHRTAGQDTMRILAASRATPPRS
jgi:hypothetical protein